MLLYMTRAPFLPCYQDQPAFARQRLVTLYNLGRIARARPGDASFECLPYQLSMVGHAPTMVVTGDGESGFDSGDGA
ncbi:putative tumor differentially expressed protein [Nephila pilipes]|uniref:Putative tumor differentially expressed protein n=1 Tax=Nephila pilipes TaxID=299642 RepID=A0A8X6NN27_NEPPI|nr:putative tumor differentially expressed protein [Nephila pilipes]